MDLLKGVDIAEESDKDSEGRREVRITVALDDTLVGELKETMVSSTKLALWTAQQVRQIKAIVSDTYKMDAKSQYALQGLESVKRFTAANRKLKEQGKDAEEIKEQTGIPQVVVFNTMVKEFIGEFTESPTSFGALELAKLNN